jgi:hypothetical protein
MNKKMKLSKSIVIPLIMIIPMIFFGGSAIAADVIVAPDGSPVTEILTRVNESGTTVSLSPTLESNGSSEFSLGTTYIPDIGPGDEFEIEVTFSPTADYDSSNPYTDIIVLYYGFSVWGQIELEGITLVEETKEENANPVAPLLGLYNELIDEELIKGKGHGKRARWRLAAFTKMLERAYLAVEQEKKNRAYYQLKVADKQIKRTLKGPGFQNFKKS